MDTNIMHSVSDHLEDIYIINNSNSNIETFEKYAQDGNFIFGDITEKIIGPLDKKYSTSNVNFDSECTNIEMSVSIIDDEYLNIDYEQKEIINKNFI